MTSIIGSFQNPQGFDTFPREVLPKQKASVSVRVVAITGSENQAVRPGCMDVAHGSADEAGGFIGGHLVRRLLDEGHYVRAVDIKPLDKFWQFHPAAESIQADLRGLRECLLACRGIDHVYDLACDMGNIAFIENNKADCMVSVLISTNLLRAARASGVTRLFYASSACVYPAGKQNSTTLPALKESDAYPAQPEIGYGEEKLFSERMCQLFMEDYQLETRVARFHNSFGAMGSWCDGREKAPAAICRKVAEAKLGFAPPEIEIWGDGTRTRSFMHITDNIDGIRLLMDSDVRVPLNIGTSECVTINQLVDVVEEVAGIKLKRRYDTSKPQGVMGRNSDNTLIKELLEWEPATSLQDGIAATYPWIESEVAKRGKQ